MRSVNLEETKAGGEHHARSERIGQPEPPVKRSRHRAAGGHACLSLWYTLQRRDQQIDAEFLTMRKLLFLVLVIKRLPVVQLSHEKERQCPKTLKDGTHDSFSRLGFYMDDAFAEKNWITVAAAIKKVKSATEKTEACCFSPAITFDGGK